MAVQDQSVHHAAYQSPGMESKRSGWAKMERDRAGTGAVDGGAFAAILIVIQCKFRYGVAILCMCRDDRG